MAPKSVGAPPMEQQMFRNRYLLGTACSRFQDHDSHDAIAAYYGERPDKEAPILPTLFAVQFYVVYGATPESSPTLPLRLLEAARKSMREPHFIRLDVYFLPGADSQACAEHYRAEKASRLPAQPPLWFVKQYRMDGTNFSKLYMVTDQDWPTRGLSSASFDSDDPDEPDWFAVETDIPIGDMSPRAIGAPNPLGSTIHDLTFCSEFEKTNELYDQALKGDTDRWSLSELQVALPDTERP